MAETSKKPDAEIDDDDFRILGLLQQDATLSLQRIAERVNLSKTTVWNRIQRMVQNGTILRQAAILDPQKVGLEETFFVSVRTANHDFDWLERFKTVINEMPQITEAHRLAGTLDYLLKVQVPSTRAFDAFYKELVSRISIHDVSSSLSMETIKRSLDINVPGKMCSGNRSPGRGHPAFAEPAFQLERDALHAEGLVWKRVWNARLKASFEA